jgi:acetyl esterase/lipase
MDTIQLYNDLPEVTLTPMLPPSGRASGAAMIVCPGGGYVMHADHEAEPVAQWLADLGIAAFVLRYRLTPKHFFPAMLDDLIEAIQRVRQESDRWGISPTRVGVLGFSAGGHLCSLLATHPHAAAARPDLAVLIYPVISLQSPAGHAWCRECLLGKEPSDDEIAALSSHLHVSAETAPMFLVHTSDDEVSCLGSLYMASALKHAGVSCELHLYAHGGHGYGLAADAPILNSWPHHCAVWLRGRGFV